MSNTDKAMPWDLPRFRNWVAVGRVNQLVRKQLSDALQNIDLDLPTYEVIAALYRFQGLTQTELADKLLVGRSNLSMLLPELESTGWIKREADSKDKRIRRVFLTASGSKKASAGLAIQSALIEHMMGSISNAECDAIGAMMIKVINYIEDNPFEPR